MIALRWTLALALSYLLGGISFSYIAGRLARGVDLRDVGSGNLGATNAIRELGAGWGVAVLLLDAAKGFAAVLLGEFFVGPGLAPVLAALAAVLGHSYTPYLGFRGGKGVAASGGAFLRLAPLAMGLAFGVFLVLFAATRIVSVASLAASLALPIFVFWRAPANTALQILALVTAVFVWLRHRGNLERLLRGTEPRFSLKRRRG